MVLCVVYLALGGGGGLQRDYDKPWTAAMKRVEESPGKEESSPSIIGGVGIGASSGVKTMIKEGKSGFTAAQLQELEVQSLIQKHLAAGLPVPYHLVLPIWKSVAATFGTSQGGSIHKQYPSFIGFSTQGFDYRNMVDPEPGRCRRTDGKKWRCSKSIVPDQKYCAQHMHRGRQRSRKPVEASEACPSSANSLKGQLENSSNVSNSVGLQLMTKSSNSTDVSRSNMTTTSSYYGSKKRVSCITVPSITTSISSGTISATAATTNTATTTMAFMSNKSNQCIGSNDSGSHVRNNCFIRGSSNNRNLIAGRNISPGLGFSPKSVLRGIYQTKYAFTFVSSGTIEIPVVGCNNLSFDKRGVMEPEPGRCRRTDGKKWRCSRNVVPDQKYCGRHMHRGAKKQVNSFQPTTIVANSGATCNTARLPPTIGIPCRTVSAIPNTNLSISIPGSPPQIYNDQKSTSSSSSDTTITDTSINAHAIRNEEEVLREIFEPGSVEAILKLKWPEEGCGDKLIWLGNQKGIFSIKDCHQIMSRGISSTENNELWAKIWESNLHESFRNEQRHSGKKRIEDFVRILNDNVMDFYNALKVRLDTTSFEKGTETWTRPPSNYLKANTDAAYREGRTALAFVLRDDFGNIVYLASKLERASSPLEAEFMALECALKLSEAHHWSNILWSADSQEMVNAINAVRSRRSGTQDT
ncbi:hypothetical protein FNV43_RR18238 [Rhamnella rubrinervis]|uniref:Growth-regulating factor n=1 Tax=Rhamnella rubrinervis TaxID=2594499 RepID=A0A8K0GY11_9ROSA|nr:hypothetical protein FNV43_RR18238 [Rhamnella rubrinervis]